MAVNLLLNTVRVGTPRKLHTPVSVNNPKKHNGTRFYPSREPQTLDLLPYRYAYSAASVVDFILANVTDRIH